MATALALLWESDAAVRKHARKFELAPCINKLAQTERHVQLNVHGV